ncbi:MAG: hypothetical protein ACRYFV_14210 [Janthinobacterium lividum]
MLPEDIDDLFRQKLDGHATPPGDDLWARLQLPADDKEPLDTLFRDGLNAHATQPRRELWERLEDEHLRPQPRKRRVAAWWQYSAAAVLLLMLLAGGAGLWRGGYLSPATGNIAVTKSAHQSGPITGRAPLADVHKAEPNSINAEEQAIVQVAPATNQPRAGAPPTAFEKNKKYFSGQATASAASTSNTPIATTTRPRRAATTPQVAAGHRTLGQQPDAVAGQLASAGGRKTPASQHLGSSQVVPATAVAANHSDKADAPTLALAPSPAKTDASFDVIEVDVRRGPDGSRSASPVAPAVVAVAEVAPTPAHRPRLRLGGLLRQADRLVHGEGVNLAEATGLPEAVTLQARLGGRLVSKTIQL